MDQGTIVLTGANSSVGIPATEYLLRSYPKLTLVLTVRNAASADENTARLRNVISQYRDAKATILELDLANLTNVRDVVATISSKVSSGELPRIRAIICNAMYWNLVSAPELTVDGYDKTVQVGHIAHVALVLRLLSQFTPDGGRVVLLSSANHHPGKTPMEKYPANIPLDMDELIHPKPHDTDYMGRGMERYSNAKLLTTTWMHALNRYLEKDPQFSKITAVAINPGGPLCDSRAFRTNAPPMMVNMQKFLFRPFRPLYRLFDKGFRNAAEAAVDIVDLATNRAHPGARGYFVLLDRELSAPQSLDEEVQDRVWVKSASWAKVTKDDTLLHAEFE